MKNHVWKLAVVAGLLGASTLGANAASTKWQIDPQHSDAQFAVTHLMISTVRGEFHGLKGTIELDDKDITKSSVEVTIDANSVDTREPNRDKDLKSDKFFNTDKFPTLSFKSTKVEQGADGKLKVTGDLTIRGVTKQVVLEVSAPKPAIKDPWGMQRTAFLATTKINRQDFGVAWNAKLDSGGVVVSDNVDITLDVEAVIPPAAK
jgi:polyisoprenoid-binding protein YceI